MKGRKILGLAGAVIALAFSMQVHALTLSSDDADYNGTNGIPPGGSCATIIATKALLECLSGSLADFDESNQSIDYSSTPDGGEGVDTGLNDNYAFSCTDDSGLDCTLTHTGTEALSSDPLWLLIVDGNNEDYWYLFDLAGVWDGSEDLNLFCFWGTLDSTGLECGNTNGQISAIYFFGDSTNDLAEPSTLALLGIGFLALGVIRRRRRTG